MKSPTSPPPPPPRPRRPATTPPASLETRIKIEQHKFWRNMNLVLGKVCELLDLVIEQAEDEVK